MPKNPLPLSPRTVPTRAPAPMLNLFSTTGMDTFGVIQTGEGVPAKRKRGTIPNPMEAFSVRPTLTWLKKIQMF